MRIEQVSTADLQRLIGVGREATDPDRYALSVLQRELDRRQVAVGDKGAAQ